MYCVFSCTLCWLHAFALANWTPLFCVTEHIQNLNSLVTPLSRQLAVVFLSKSGSMVHLFSGHIKVEKHLSVPKRKDWLLAIYPHRWYGLKIKLKPVDNIAYESKQDKDSQAMFQI